MLLRNEGILGKMTMKTYAIKGVFGIIVLWFLLLGLMSIARVNQSSNGFTSESSSGGENTEILRRMDVALSEIQALKRNNVEMKRIIEGGSSLVDKLDNINSHDRTDPEADHGQSHADSVGNFVQGSGPSDQYERSRRLLELDMKELWYSIRSKSERLGELDFDQTQDLYRLLRSHLQTLRKSDGFESFRDRETKELARIVQSRIRSLQNPTDCNTAKKLVCNLNKGCGFGCQVHHVCYCLIVAYATGRTLILESRGWRYNRGGWDKVFLPLSDSCTSSSGESRAEWNGIHSTTQVLQLPIVDFLKPRPPFLPVSIPLDLSSRLEKVHGEPHIWWVGQFMTYILRPQPNTKAMLDESKSKANLRSPVVGLHVRRTDKIGTEASFHSLKEYMVHAEEYFAIREKQGEHVVRRVFIASDDPSVITEAEKAYPSPFWEILGDKGVAQSAALSQRYNGLNGIIRDVFLLAECDFLVCTFSSQVCRLAYEIMQTKHTDASERFVSLDDIYYYGGGIGLDQEVHLAHKSKHQNELELEVGDKIGVAGNHWNGMSKGTNRRTNKVGLYPSYKARNQYSKINFPEKKWWSHADEA